LLALIIVIGSRRYSRKIPGAIIAVIATSACVHFFNLDVFTITKKFGPIPSMLPTPSFPSITLDSLQAVFPDAITIALLGAIESLLSAVVADGMTGFRHLSNAELVGQGIGNLGSVIFGGFPATGAIARTTANIQLGARTPLSGMIHAVTMFVLMILFAPYAGMIPLPALAAILCFVAYNMAEFDHFFELLKGPKSDRLILLTTFCLTVFIDLTVAVQAGVLMAAFSFLKHMSEKTTCKVVELVKEEAQTDEKQSSSKPVPQAVVKGVQIFEIEGPFFFAVTDILSDALKVADKKPHTFILRMRDVPLIDISGMQALKKFYEKCAKHGIRLYITEIRLSVMRILIQSGVTHDIPETVFLPSLDKALEVAKR
ncbi:MAG TPA: SulP family inorganic anion transporter, partial [Chlamydiales bacterium]|nr:SulP family inorganic anion transporter [Chlamydiales bacterium]